MKNLQLKLKQIIVSVLCFIIRFLAYPIINFSVEIFSATPKCCGDVVFVGSYISLFRERLIYQCKSCGKVIVIFNPHCVSLAVDEKIEKLDENVQ